MSKKASKKDTNIIRKKEQENITTKFSPAELAAKEKEFSLLCVEKAKAESKINSLKEAIKSGNYKLNSLAKELEAGGESGWEECDVEINIKDRTKKYFFEGELVKEEEAVEADFQLEIDEETNDEDDN